MALNTPIPISLSAFDATESQVFAFTVIGGDQVVGNKLTIIDNVSGDIVYTNEVASYVYNQVVPANTLTNGGYYGFYFQTKNINGDYSSQSVLSTFKCFTTPILSFINIPTLNVIESASFRFLCQYTQAEGEQIDYFYFYLYNRNQQEIDRSPIITSDMAIPEYIIPTFQHTFSGLIDDEIYFIRALGITVNGTTIDSGMISFSVDYSYEGTYIMVNAENNADKGYVLLYNNVSEIDGQVYDAEGHLIDPPIEDEKIYLTNGEELVWGEGFQFKNNQFTKIKWWHPVQIGETLMMFNEEGNTFITIELKRGIPIGGTNAKDYILISGYENRQLYMRKMSALKDPVNNLSSIETLVNVDGSNVTILFNTSATVNNYMDLDTGDTNVEFGKLTDIFYLDEPQAPNITDVDIVGEPVEYTELTVVTLKNSIVDKIYISKNNITEIPEELPEWDNGTVLSCDFTNGISAGNVDWFLSNVNNVKIKRREKGTFQYVIIHKHDIHGIEDLNFEFKDTTVPSGYDFEYAFVACVDDDEGSYYITNTTTCFNGLFVSDGEKTLKLYSNYVISSAQDNQLIGTAQPYGSRYPIIIRNPNINYRTVTIQGDILGLQDDEYTFIMDRNTIVKQKQEWDEFLTNGKTKVIKDWNGNILIGGITTAPSYTYNQVNQNGIPTISFTITEQGQYNNQKDLYNSGFSNVPS